MKRFISILAVLAFQVALIGSVCATPRAHSCCEGMDCTTAIACCAPSPLKSAAPQTGLQAQQNFFDFTTTSVLFESPAMPRVVAALDRTVSLHSPPLFLNNSSLLL